MAAFAAMTEQLVGSVGAKRQARDTGGDAFRPVRNVLWRTAASSKHGASVSTPGRREQNGFKLWAI
jgi:hypothetical protein